MSQHREKLALALNSKTIKPDAKRREIRTRLATLFPKQNARKSRHPMAILERNESIKSFPNYLGLLVRNTAVARPFARSS